MIVNGIERSNTIVVLLGGNSPERDISLDSGKNVIDGLTENGLDVVGVDPQNRNWQQQLLQVNPCYIFNILHGPNGEDGLIQGFLETYGFLYSGSNVLGSALGMDKGRSKEIWLYNEYTTWM